MSMPEKRFEPNQFYRELMGVLGLSPFDPYNSASRKQMFASHIGQTLVINGSTERYIQTGMEREYGKYTFSVKMPVNADIVRLVDRYPPSLDGSIKQNPETLVIYEDVDTKEIGCLSLVDYFSHHPYFGFQYKRTKAMGSLRAQSAVRKDTILMNSPAITETGGYKYGRELNAAFMTHPSVSEDGIMICRDVLDKVKFKTYVVRDAQWGGKHFPLNIYGDDTKYKPHPDIGDYVREDGLLMAFRTYDDAYAPVDQSITRTQTTDHIHDRKLYAAGPGDAKLGKGRIVDIRVQHDPESHNPTTPVGMEVQTTKYDNARRKFYQDIYNEYLRLKHDRPGRLLNITHEFHRLVVQAISVVRGSIQKPATGEKAQKVNKTYKGTPLDDWRVEFVIEYEIAPTIGFKMTDTHGG